jgi:anhydro-N-acetylmuramic acid kinase
VQQLLNDGYFLAPAPKSTGKEYFSLAWLGQNSAELSPVPPEDIQASLCQLTATSIAEAIQRFAPNTEQVFVCGGGTHNDFLLELLKGLLACPLDSSAVCGIHPDHVEAMAFAWLARQSLSHLPGNLKAVTGAARAVTLGGIYQPTST